MTERGFAVVACDADKLKPRYAAAADVPALTFEEDLLPLTPHGELVSQAKVYLERTLPRNVWNHSHRTFYLSVAIAKTQFDWHFDPESYYLACLFHDIGCTPENIAATKMSFEFYGGILARDWLLGQGASKDLADGVAEVIFRHTDFVKGDICLHGQMIQLGTLLDNHGARNELINRKTVDSIIDAFPRLSWNEGFAAAMEAEVDAKPWSHTTCFEGAIWKQSRANTYMSSKYTDA